MSTYEDTEQYKVGFQAFDEIVQLVQKPDQIRDGWVKGQFL